MRTKSRYAGIFAIVTASVALTHIAKALWGRTGQFVVLFSAVGVVFVAWLASVLAARAENRSRGRLQSLISEIDDEDLEKVIGSFDETERTELFDALSEDEHQALRERMAAGKDRSNNVEKRE